MSTQNCFDFWLLGKRIHNGHNNLFLECEKFIDDYATQLFSKHALDLLAHLNIPEDIEYFFRRQSLNITEPKKLEFLNDLRRERPEVNLTSLKSFINFATFTFDELHLVGESELFEKREYSSLMRDWGERNRTAVDSGK